MHPGVSPPPCASSRTGATGDNRSAPLALAAALLLAGTSPAAAAPGRGPGFTAAGAGLLLSALVAIGAAFLWRRRRRREAARFERAFQASPACLAMVHLRDGRLMHVNASFERLTGYCEAEAVGRTSLDLGLWACGRDYRLAAAALRRRGEAGEREVEFRARDGRVLHGRCSATVLSLGGEEVVLVTIIDLTERRRLEEQQLTLLRRIEAVASEWQQTFDSIDAPTVILDGSGRITRLNRAAMLAAGRPYADLLGKGLAAIGSLEPWLAARSLVEEVRVSGAAGTAQAHDPHADRSFSLFATPAVPGAAAGDSRVILVVRDVTATVRLQASLRQSERTAAIGALVAGVAHEVRNPLFAITANLDALEAELAVGKPYAESLAVVNDAANRLNRLMADLLDFGNSGPSERVAGRLDEAVRQAARASQRAAGEKAVTLHLDLASGLPAVSMDRHRLAQAFENVLHNALERSPRGGLVSVRLRCDGGDERRVLVCEFDDTGPGLEAGDLPLLFQPFFTRRRGGTGLGLSIVQKVVEEHGGTVEAMNLAEGGARLRLRLPVVEGPQELP